ncbi:RsiV family protein [Moraxella marmotae]|uniref:RsiV family protein n=1 Tax=Moraxella marmotae TaxID=3344520 RepID=UPI0035F3F59A
MKVWLTIAPLALLLAACSKLPDVGLPSLGLGSESGDKSTVSDKIASLASSAVPSLGLGGDKSTVSDKIGSFEAVAVPYTLPDDVRANCKENANLELEEIGCPVIEISIAKMEPKWIQDSLNLKITNDNNPELIKFRRALDRFARESVNDDFLPYHWSVDTQFVGMHGTLAQFMVSDETYAGGAHGMNTVSFYIYDLALGSEIGLGDLEPESLPEGVDTLYQLAERAYNRYLFEHQADIGDINEHKQSYPFELTDNFYFNEQGLVLSYNPYALGPYAMGSVELIIPFEDLVGVLRPEYLPNSSN